MVDLRRGMVLTTAHTQIEVVSVPGFKGREVCCQIRTGVIGGEMRPGGMFHGDWDQPLLIEDGGCFVTADWIRC